MAKITEKQRNTILKLHKLKASTRDIRDLVGLSSPAIKNVVQIYNLVKEEKHDEALRMFEMGRIGRDTYMWAYAVNDMKLPSKEENEQIMLVEEPEPEQKPADDQTDEGQMVRIMCSLESISRSLEIISALFSGLFYCESKKQNITGDDIVQLTNFFADYARQIREDVRKMKGAKNG